MVCNIFTFTGMEFVIANTNLFDIVKIKSTIHWTIKDLKFTFKTVTFDTRARP